jgi:hypothetical protein
MIQLLAHQNRHLLPSQNLLADHLQSQPGLYLEEEKAVQPMSDRLEDRLSRVMVGKYPNTELIKLSMSIEDNNVPRHRGQLRPVTDLRAALTKGLFYLKTTTSHRDLLVDMKVA